MEDIIFDTFEKIRTNSSQKKQIQKETILRIIKEFGFEKNQDQLLFALRVERSSEDNMEEIKERVFSKLSYKQDLFTLLHHDINKKEKNEVLKRNSKIHMIYDIHNTIKEADMRSWIRIMEEYVNDGKISKEDVEYVNDGKISKEDVEYIKKQTQNASGDFYEKRETDTRFSSILKTIEEEQDDSWSTIGDYVHITRNRVAHGIYHSIKQWDKLMKEIVKSMSKDEKQEAKNLLKEKRTSWDIFVMFSDFDKRVEEILSQ